MSEPQTPMQTPPKWAHKPQRWKRLLTAADNDPSIVLKDPRCAKPDFCDAFLDVCDGKCLEAPDASLEYATNAHRLALEIGDRHLVNRALGVIVHSRISRTEWDEARTALEAYKEPAMACCAFCRSDYYRRTADLLVETHLADGALDELMKALDEISHELDEDTMARIRFIRGIAHHFRNDPQAALADAGLALMELSLEAPPGYFMDTLAFVGCFLQKVRDAELENEALGHLLRFKDRLHGQRGKSWDMIRTRLAWVEGAIYARLDDKRRAGDRFESVRKTLLDTGPAKHAGAVSIDLMQVLARTPSETNVRAMRRIVARCLRLEGLEKGLKRRLQRIESKLFSAPEKAPAYLAKQRAAWLVPVPGLV